MQIAKAPPRCAGLDCFVICINSVSQWQKFTGTVTCSTWNSEQQEVISLCSMSGFTFFFWPQHPFLYINSDRAFFTWQWFVAWFSKKFMTFLKCDLRWKSNRDMARVLLLLGLGGFLESSHHQQASDQLKPKQVNEVGCYNYALRLRKTWE